MTCFAVRSGCRAIGARGIAGCSPASSSANACPHRGWAASRARSRHRAVRQRRIAGTLAPGATVTFAARTKSFPLHGKQHALVEGKPRQPGMELRGIPVSQVANEVGFHVAGQENSCSAIRAGTSLTGRSCHSDYGRVVRNRTSTVSSVSIRSLLTWRGVPPIFHPRFRRSTTLASRQV
jgi:hypothetical protein